MRPKHVIITLKSGKEVALDMEPASYETLVNDFVGFVENESVNVQGIKVYGAKNGSAFTLFLELSNVAAIEVEGEVP